MTSRRSRAVLLDVAKKIAAKLKQPGVNCGIMVRTPGILGSTHTDGWRAELGSLGRGRPKLEVWLDRFAGFPQRRFWLGFYSERRTQLRDLAKRVSGRLRPHRVLTNRDVAPKPFFRLTSRLIETEFGRPILEMYDTDEYFYGIYVSLPASRPAAATHTVEHAAAFFESVACAAGRRNKGNALRDDYAEVENRAYVANHIARERSQLLPMQCKLRDNFTCRICGMQYRDAYGELGAEFAEAHHIVPLGRLRGSTRTRLDDLITVCADCHRMLHRMSGRKDDIPQLKRIVRRRTASRRR